jgi:cytochrome c553
MGTPGSFNGGGNAHNAANGRRSEARVMQGDGRMLQTGIIAVVAMVAGLVPSWRRCRTTEAGNGVGGGAGAQAPAVAAKALDLVAGEGIYKVACLACHGVEGTGGHGGGPAVVGKMNASQVRAITTTGRNNMPTFREIYDANQIRDVAEYIVQQLAARPRQEDNRP